jgi:predicted outer membrane protein
MIRPLLKPAVLALLLLSGSVATADERDTAKIDAAYNAQVLALTSLSLLVTKLVAEKVSVPKIVHFAQLENAENETLTHVYRQLLGKDAGAATDAELETHLAPQGKEELTKLRRASAGPEFTREYFLLEAALHQQLLQLHEAYLKDRPSDVYSNVATLADWAAREHLQLMTDLKEDIRLGIVK